MRGLIVDYFGVLDGTEEDRQGWRELLAEIGENDVKLAVLSNEPQGPGAQRVKDDATTFYGIDTVILSGETGVEKPEAQAFENAADVLGFGPRECVLVDDAIENVHGAVQIGMIGVFYQAFERQAVELRSLFGLGK
ncbi:HAD family hydrolase [Dietzia sp.]|uniref:HAD family hydrolase n=1 Tax=Dietzia sp. TaxID=1871616 RepID=UPI002FDB11C6